MHNSRRTRTRGNVMAEMPGAIWLFIIGFLIPFIGFVTLGYRAIVFYNGVRDCCYQASIEQTYTEAVNKAKAVLTTDLAAFNGIQCDPNADLSVRVVTKNITNGNESETGKLATNTVNTQANRYFIRVYVNAKLNPILNIGNTTFLSGIPGLTGPIDITRMMYQVYAENPNGLES